MMPKWFKSNIKGRIDATLLIGGDEWQALVLSYSSNLKDVAELSHGMRWLRIMGKKLEHVKRIRIKLSFNFATNIPLP